jgi:hypothetical protein
MTALARASKQIVNDGSILSSERMLHMEYNRKCSVGKKNYRSSDSRGLSPRRTDWRQTASRKVTLNLPLVCSKKANEFCTGATGDVEWGLGGRTRIMAIAVVSRLLCFKEGPEPCKTTFKRYCAYHLVSRLLSTQSDNIIGAIRRAVRMARASEEFREQSCEYEKARGHSHALLASSNYIHYDP